MGVPATWPPSSHTPLLQVDLPVSEVLSVLPKCETAVRDAVLQGEAVQGVSNSGSFSNVPEELHL